MSDGPALPPISRPQERSPDLCQQVPGNRFQKAAKSGLPNASWLEKPNRFSAPLVPEYDPVLHIPDHDGILGNVDDLGLVAEHVRLAFQLVLCPQAICDIPDIYHDELFTLIAYKG